jgi:predicted amidophosphoribosyltransferase
VVDDVVTSGATMTAASAALRARGAAVVLGLAAARTAPPEGPPSAQADHAE